MKIHGRYINNHAPKVQATVSAPGWWGAGPC